MEIQWKKCQKCGFQQHSTHIRCLKCKSQEFLNEKAVGNAILLTYTLLTAPPAEFRNKKSCLLGVVEFENGIKALGQIESNKNLEIGIKMVPFESKICDNLDGEEIVDFVFKPLE